MWGDIGSYGNYIVAIIFKINWYRNYMII
jgi:hypothetical protein